MRIGVVKEQADGEARVALTPDTAKKYLKKGLELLIESGAGANAGFPDEEFTSVGVKTGSRDDALKSDIVLSVNRLPEGDIGKLKDGTVAASYIDPFKKDDYLQKVGSQKVSLFGMELIPRISRAQSMDALSSQANIAGYRAVLEATQHYKRFFPLMMTSAGSSKATKVVVLGAGVAGLQAIATARRLGATVKSFDVRPEVKEQIESLGAKFIEIDVGEEGSGKGGYAKELSEEGKKKLMAGLTEELKKSDVIISTANIPGKKAPILVSEEAVQGMRPGSVVVDMAAANGGNCPLSEANKTVVKHNVTLVGLTNFPTLMAGDASNFYSRNLMNLLFLMVQTPKKGESGEVRLNIDLEDEIIKGALATHQGEVRFKGFN